MRILLLGAPGAGKGTQAKLLSKHFNVPQISTGDIFRSNIKECTTLGNAAEAYLKTGRLVPDELTFALVRARLNDLDCKDGFILDGFPRKVVLQIISTSTSRYKPTQIAA